MTNHWNDIANSDCILAIGSNAAENHPASFGHIMKAKEKGAKLISVDPRFTRTSKTSDIYVPMRSGTDIAFVGGMIKWVLDDMERNPQNYNMVYVTEYTNAAFLINPDFKGPVDLDGVFSGLDAANRKYDKSTWQYQLDDKGVPKTDKTLKDSNCVFQILKKHFARYDSDKVSRITGTPKDTFLEICETYAATGKTGKAGTIMYAMGTTQHTYGTQNIRSYAILQLLLGNIGVSGGGINALRGESNVQGSTDMCLLAHILPGYLSMIQNKDETLKDYLERVTPKSNDPKSANWWSNYAKYIVSLLKAWYGDAATTDNDFGFGYLPKSSGNSNYYHINLFEAMHDGIIKGLICWGQNPAVGGPNSNFEREALDKLDWLVSVDLWETDTSVFWKRPGVNPASIQTEVFLIPAVAHFEKEGSVTNSGRWMQWRYKGANAPGDSLPDLDIVNELGLKLKDLYKSGGKHAEAITKLTWDNGHPADPHRVAKEINGYDLTKGKLMASFGGLKDDGTTSSGNWLYCGSYVEPGTDQTAPDGNRAARRILDDGPFNIGLHSKWAWCWPVNRRIIYNRASVDLNGNPWSDRYPVIKFTGATLDGKYATSKWEGDVPDGGWYPLQNPDGSWRDDAKYPFIMKAEGHALIFGAGRADGPLPEHYEPWESPVQNLLSGTENSPTFLKGASADSQRGGPDKYPIVCTTYRLVEHWQAGSMTRNLPWLVEMQPEMFVEISEELANDKGIKNGSRLIVESARGQVEAVAMVTKRFKPFQIDGKTVHQIGMPWHWGYAGLSTGDSGNKLTPHVGDANTMIPEYKAFLCNVRRA